MPWENWNPHVCRRPIFLLQVPPDGSIWRCDECGKRHRVELYTGQ